MRKRALIVGCAVVVALVMAVPAALGAASSTASCTGQIITAKPTGTVGGEVSFFATLVGANGVFASFVVEDATAHTADRSGPNEPIDACIA